MGKLIVFVVLAAAFACSLPVVITTAQPAKADCSGGTCN
jgi:hypothetical protein